MWKSFAIFGTSFIIALMTTPLLIWFSKKINFLDRPDGKLKPQDQPIPNLGGVAIFLGFTAALIFAFFIKAIDWNSIFSILLSAILLILIGFIDDKFDIKGLKLAAHIGAGVLLGIQGIRFVFISEPMISVAYTAIVVVITCNAINLIDGVDGLAGGVVGIASVFFFILFAISNNVLGMVVALALLGGAVAFLIFNFNPASIYLGNSGSLFAGLITAVMMTLYPTSENTSLVLAPIIVIAIPIADMILAFVRRIINHRPFLAGDRSHFYDHLLYKGLPLKKMILIIYIICTLLGMLAVLTSASPQSIGLMIFLLVALSIIIVITKMKFYKIID